MASIFSKIVEGDIPAYKVAENDKFLAFLDIFPLQIGHTLVIPKKEIDYIFDLSDADYLGLMLFVKEVAEKIKKVIP
jgi:histidine triad (HIT) family protein